MLNVRSIMAVAFLLVTPLTLGGGTDIEFHPVQDMGDRDLPFSQAVRAGDFLFLSGMIGIDPETGNLVEGGIQAETRATMEAIKAAVERHGASMDRVIKCTVFLADMSEWSAMNEVYVEFFPENKPARSALGASGLALGAKVEIECIASL